MLTRAGVMVGVLCALVLGGSIFALYVGVQEVRLHRSGPRRELLATELTPATRGHLLVLGCARHDIEVTIGEDGGVVSGERSLGDRSYFALTAADDCAEDAPLERLRVLALVEATEGGAGGGQRGLARLYGAGYKPPPTRVLIDGVIGYGVGDGYRHRRALKELARLQMPAALQTAPLLVKDRRPGRPSASYGTAAVGLHGLLLLGFLLGMALRRHRRGGLPAGFTEEEEP